MTFKKPNPKQNFFDLEQEILKWWKEQKILEKSIENRDSDKFKVFYDGPITANGTPHHGHMLTFAMKDIIPRYWTMKGFRVNRSLGWDCHGIPVEYEIEKKLGFTQKKDIEKFGIAEFNKLCRESVEKHISDIITLEEMSGRLTNSDEEYSTMDPKFIESVWWSLKELYDKGVLYEGFKVVPYSTRAGTTLSNAEVALGGYKKIIDPAITVKFTLKDDENTVLLAWTTTPWTIPSNLGLAVGKDITYAGVKIEGDQKTYIVARDLVEKVFEKFTSHSVVAEFKASDLIGKKYTPPFKFFENANNAHQIFEGFHVNTESGTGIVHLAPYGAEDNEIFKEVGIDSFDVLDEQGDFNSLIPEYNGKNYKDANPVIIEDLKAVDKLFNHEEYEHDMPMCWRTNTPLIYKPITSWFIGVSKMRDELVANNEKINWTPNHIKNGRFGNWLAEVKDWGISRKRYWGTPLPIWQSASGKTIVIGSFEELKKLSGKEITDPHRPFIDEIEFEFDGEKYERITDVLDVWYDSGAMPFARFHYPFENQENFKKRFPADYISEAIDQTRGWFYSLHAVSTTLFGSEAYKNIVVTGHILGEDGNKLSKSKKNYTPPEELIREFGADAIRLEFFSSPITYGENSIVSKPVLKIQTQEMLLPVWNIYTYFVTYANLFSWEIREELARNKRLNKNNEYLWDHIPFNSLENELDTWILVRLQEVIKIVNESMDRYEFARSYREIKVLVEDLSKWFIRRSRSRFADGNLDALDTLFYVFIEILKLLAPFAPFVTEYIYREIVAKYTNNLPDSIHLCDYPAYDKEFLENNISILKEMSVIRNICEMGQSIRTGNQIKLRQPLSLIEVSSSNPLITSFSGWMESIILDELNIKAFKEVVKIEHKDDGFVVTENPQLSIIIGIHTFITDDLKREGIVREITRSIQAERKNMGLNTGDLISLNFCVDQFFRDIITRETEEIKRITNCTHIHFVEDLDNATVLRIDEDKILKFNIKKNE